MMTYYLTISSGDIKYHIIYLLSFLSVSLL